VRAAEIDTVVDTRLTVNSVAASPRDAHDNNVIGTMNIVAACTGSDSPVRKFVFKGSAHYYGSEQDDPAFFTEQMRRTHPPRTPLERDMAEAEDAVAEFAEKNPRVEVALLRFANVLGPDVDTAFTRMFSLPLVPMVLGFDPRLQFIHEDDVVHALEHCVFNETAGVYNVAADGVLALSEAISLLGKRPAPVLPPWGTGLLAGPLRSLGLRIPSEMINLLRFGRGLDNRRFRAAGFRYGHTSRETVAKFGNHLRVSPVMSGVDQAYRYEREVEEFLRWSPHVSRRLPTEGVEADHEPLGI
jgi:UDP-glucose 4-epimerase